jgi:hypothetical protein
MCLLFRVHPLVCVIEIVKQEGHVSFVILGKVINDRILLVNLYLYEASRSLIIFSDCLKLRLNRLLALVLLFINLVMNSTFNRPESH